jgi:hypothetical protein|tara:strand:+ start:1913 stop:2554 length:642 start_codon:yes stop_codon:yes gene_type:complete
VIAARALLTVVLAFGLAMPAMAQAKSPKQEMEAGRQLVAGFGKCMADAKPEMAKAVVLADKVDFGDPAWKGALDSRCMGLYSGRLHMHLFYYQASLAERLSTSSLPATALVGVADIAPLNASLPSDAPNAVRYTMALRLGECVARANPAGARAVFATRIDSSDEIEALQALGGEIAGCVPEGREVAIDRTSLRAGLAITYYRLAARLADKGEA